jgi:hypothetical protein
LLALSAAVIAAPAFGQFFGRATPFDGSSVYFSTPLKLKNTTQPIYGKIFRADLAGVHLQEFREIRLGPVSIGSPGLSNTYSSPSPFDAPDARATVSSFAPDFFITDRFYGTILAVHQDWSALVNDENPAHPGEILHTYATGLGATIPAVLYGETAPEREPLARLADPLSCVINNGWDAAPAEVLFQGRAPNMAGI